MTEDLDSCSVCLKPKHKKGGGYITQFIDTCQCDRLSSKDGGERAQIKFCAKCAKPMEQGRSGSLTQWIFKGARCNCAPHSSRDEIPSRSEKLVDEDADGEELQLSFDFPKERYRPLKLLGQGANGRVYLCKDKLLKNKVAVKVLNSITTANLISFQQEARLISLLNHPNIIQVLDFGVIEQSKPYMVMPYTSGRTLSQLLMERRFLEPRTSLMIMLKVCSALAFAHSRGIYHRDIKPENIIVSETDSIAPEVHIFDFGAALTLVPHEGQSEYQGRTVAGTPMYMSPDQARGLTFDARSEVYSVGCVLFQCLTGSPPFHGDTAIEIISKHANEQHPRLQDMSTQAVSPGMEDIVSRCLKKEPSDRYQSMLDLKEDIDRFLASSSSWTIESTVYRSSLPVAKKNNSVKKALYIAPVAIMLLAFLVVTLQSHTSPNESQKEETTHNPASSEIHFSDTLLSINSNEIDQLSEITKNASEKSSNKKRSIPANKSQPGAGMNSTKTRDCSHSKMTDAQLNELPDKSAVTSLSLDFTKVKTLDTIKHFPNLRRLNLGETSITDKSLSNLLSLDNIAYLGLSNTNVTVQGLKPLLQMKKLRGVSLHGCTNVRPAEVLELKRLSPIVDWAPYGECPLSRTKHEITKQIESGNLAAAIKAAKRCIAMIEMRGGSGPDLVELHFSAGSWEYQLNDLVHAKSNLLRSLHLAKQENDPVAEMNALEVLRAIGEQQGIPPKDRITYATALIPYYRKFKGDNSFEVAKTLAELAELYRYDCQFDRAKEYRKLALNAYLSIDENSPSAGKALPFQVRFADSFRQVGDHRESELLLDRSLRLTKRAVLQGNKTDLNPDTALEIAELYQGVQKWDKSKDALALTKTLLADSTNLFTRFREKRLLAMYYLTTGNQQKAEYCIAQGIEPINSIPSNKREALWFDAQLSAGQFFSALGKLDEADKYLQSAIQWAKQHDPPRSAAPLQYLTENAILANKSDLTIRRSQEALSILKKLPVPPNANIAVHLRLLSDAYRKKGDDANAMKALHRAKKYAVLANSPFETGLEALLEAQLLDAMGKTVESRRLVKESLRCAKLAEQQGDRISSIAYQLVDIGNLEAKLKEPKAAIEHLKMGVELARKYQLDRLLIHGQNSLSAVSR